jgi:PHP family Zn ribbon phosphoesterase
MNWRVPDLDGKSIVSFSDPHSLARLGREATEFGGHLSYDELYDDLQNQNIISTIEFFPEEGKYHYSGHRKCNMVRSPEEVIKYGEECPLCHKTLTIGVAQRIEELATRSIESLELFEENGLIKSKTFSKRPGYRSLVQLEEVIALSLGVSVASKKVPQLYQQMVSTIGPEIDILTRIPLDMVGMAGGSAVVEVIQAIRQGQISIEPGFDGVYGKVSLTDEAEAAARQQLKLIQ